ncbi:protein o-mannosyl-transferase tmtc2 [Holotrichia oblita]|uniref:Protein o-mannosyl-transferase tmtc2 n=1 Tax=Holotrichia oblita TaxID=644536 RepID=A0ACB9T8F6_HOLOL|nr:protein o-mannosyl-transferase tmtc2 [Holotrichia oblita]
MIVSGEKILHSLARDEERKEWQRKNAKAQQIIISTIDRKILLHIVNCTSAKKINTKQEGQSSKNRIAFFAEKEETSLKEMESFVVDSGASSYMSNSIETFMSLEQIETNISVAKKDEDLKGLCIGTIERTECILENVIYVSELSKNLISVHAITENEGEVIFTKDRVAILKDDKKVLEGRKQENCLYIVQINKPAESMLAKNKFKKADRTKEQTGAKNERIQRFGETLARLQQDEEAERWYQAALNAQPDHVPAHITYGKLLAKNVSRVAEAEQWFRKAQKLAPDDATVYHHYGEFLASRGRYKEAAVLYEKAAELKPRDYELAVAAATAMRQAGRHDEAERWYRKAVILKPTDARGHTNLGAILHLNGKYREAADSYKEALRLQPNDVTTLTNLHKLHSVMT